MSGNSAIEWTHMTWNPLAGCTRVTAGCDHCFAFALHDSRHTIYQRNAGWWSPGGSPMPAQYGRPFSEIQLLPDRLMQPLHQMRPKMIFVNSMSDLFHSQVPEDYIRRVFAVMQEAHWHTFQVLTKRAGRLRHLGPRLDWPSNVWMGVSIEEDRLVGRANALRAMPAAVRFISAEPLLGPLPSLNLDGIHWLITGGESGKGARPCNSQWVRDLRDRCVEAGVAFFHKQWGGRTWDQFPVPPERGGEER